MTKTAVVLFNLGGPDSPAAVRPFLFNLFKDPAIIGLPTVLRVPLAALISARRAPTARAIYDEIGGRSPLLEQTEAQAEALEAALGRDGPVRVFIAMRYWHPLTEATVAAVKAFGPDDIVLLPLYPQFSTTTTGSSLEAWQRSARRAGLHAPTRILCCYPTMAGFVAAHVEGIREALAAVSRNGVRVRLLFSAHGLPEKVIAAGDPYQWQVEQTVAAIVDVLDTPTVEHVICYQSRVGPLAWIGPSTEAEIERAGKDATAAIVIPIAFVSEHSETLVELDIEYRALAEKAGVPVYHRVPTLGTAPAFIAGLADLVRNAGAGPAPQGGSRLCPADRRQCPCTEAAT